MRFVILKDEKIPKDELLAVLDEYGEFIEESTGIEPVFWVEQRNFTYVPTSPDADGDLKPTFEYRQSLAKEVHDRYGDYGTDYVVMMVHEDNFLFKGVWGTAWAYVHFKYNFLLCRYDKDNPVNTFNTLFHEGEHSHDTLIQKELGIDINPLIADHFGLPSFSYDKDYVHGASPLFAYIGKKGYQRDARMLKFLAPYLQKAFANRKEKYYEPYKVVMRQVIAFLQQYVRYNK